MTEMTKHMMTAMTMPTYSATSSVLGAARGDTEEKKRHSVKQRGIDRAKHALRENTSERKVVINSYSSGVLSGQSRQVVLAQIKLKIDIHLQILM